MADTKTPLVPSGVSIADVARARWHYHLSFDRETAPDHTAMFARSIGEGGSIFTHDRVRVMHRQLAWDTEYFGWPVHRIDFVDRDPAARTRPVDVAEALTAFRRSLPADATWYVGVEVPSEDTLLLQALSLAGFCLIESRVTYFQMAPFNLPTERYPVRAATADDAENLRHTAATARNDFDRYHADPFFTTAVADAYLGTYAANSARGFADIVVVPGDGSPPNAFFAGRMESRSHDGHVQRFGQLTLSAVRPERSGWHLRLVAELTRWFEAHGADGTYMISQTTNRAVIHNVERLGYKLGRTTHFWSAHNRTL